MDPLFANFAIPSALLRQQRTDAEEKHWREVQEHLNAGQNLIVTPSDWIWEYIWGGSIQMWRCARCGYPAGGHARYHGGFPNRPYCTWTCDCGHVSVRRHGQKADR